MCIYVCMHVCVYIYIYIYIFYIHFKLRGAAAPALCRAFADIQVNTYDATTTTNNNNNKSPTILLLLIIIIIIKLLLLLLLLIRIARNHPGDRCFCLASQPLTRCTQMVCRPLVYSYIYIYIYIYIYSVYIYIYIYIHLSLSLSLWMFDREFAQLSDRLGARTNPTSCNGDCPAALFASGGGAIPQRTDPIARSASAS